MPLSDQERVRIRGHLGYLQVAPAKTFVLGAPAAIDAQFIVEDAMGSVIDAALPLLREYLDRLDAIDGQYAENTENLAVSKIGDIELRPDEEAQLARRYAYWQGKLANLLGVMVNPYSKVRRGGINVPVE